MVTKMQAIGAAALTALSSAGALADQAIEKSPLDVSSHVESFRGALSEVKAPIYDGPVLWQNSGTQSATERAKAGALAGALICGAVIGLGSAAVVATGDYRKRSSAVASGTATFLAITALGGAFGAGIGYLTADEPVQTIAFATRVQDIAHAEPSHAEERVVRSGKTTRRIIESPFYSQVVSIPETDLLLGANSYKAPLIPGEKINAWFFVNKDGHIISWIAQPAAR